MRQARPRRRIGGGVVTTETTWRTARSTSVVPFHRRARSRPTCCSTGFLRREISVILRARTTGGDKRDRPAGTCEHTDRASDLLRKESECCCRNGSGLPRRVSEWCRKEKTKTSNNNIHLQLRNKSDPRWQPKETCPKTRVCPTGSPAKETHPNKHVSPLRNYW
jgi:hypothetical protein